MKKIIFLLLLTVAGYAQQTNFPYGIKNPAATIEVSPTMITTHGPTNVYGKVSVNNLPISIAVQDSLDKKLNISDLPSNLTLYPTTLASDVSGYVVMVTDIHDARYNTTAVNVSTPTITTTAQLVSSRISDAAVLVGQPGVFNATSFGNIRRLSGSGTANFYFEIYKRTATGVETLIGVSGNSAPVSSSSYLEFTASLVWDDGNFIATDRIVVKSYANRISGGTNPVYQFQFGGMTPVRTVLPVPFSVVDAGYEIKDNKQNSLAVDGTGGKYPTVDAVNANVVKLTGFQAIYGSKYFFDNITQYNTTTNSLFSISGNNGFVKGIAIQQDGVNRWFLGGSDNSETGGNAGTNLQLLRYADNGSYLSTLFEASRSTGAITFNNSILVPTVATSTNNTEVANTEFVNNAIANASSSSIKEGFVYSGGAQTFTVSETINTIDGLFVNGIYISPDNYSVSGVNFTITPTLAVDDEVWIHYNSRSLGGDNIREARYGSLKNLKINFLGDSLTFLGFAENALGNFADGFITLLRNEIGLSPSSVRNYGVGGNRLSLAVGGDEGDEAGGGALAMCVRYAAMDTDVDIIFVMGGTNDVGTATLAGTSADMNDKNTIWGATYQTIKGIYQTYPGVNLIWGVLPRRSLGRFGSNDSFAFSEAIKDACKYAGVPYIDLHNESGINEGNIESNPNLLATATYTDNLTINSSGVEEVDTIRSTTDFVNTTSLTPYWLDYDSKINYYTSGNIFISQDVVQAYPVFTVTPPINATKCRVTTLTSQKTTTRLSLSKGEKISDGVHLTQEGHYVFYNLFLDALLKYNRK